MLLGTTSRPRNGPLAMCLRPGGATVFDVAMKQVVVDRLRPTSVGLLADAVAQAGQAAPLGYVEAAHRHAFL